MGEALVRHALQAEAEPLKSLKVISAGVSARGGEKPTPHSVTALKKVSLDISGHVSQPLTDKLIKDALAIICMTESHIAMVNLMADPEPKNLVLFRQFVGEGNPEIPDPYGCPLPLYEECRDEMVQALPSLVEFLKEQIK
jgi:protein-tyrosine phosphatase